MTAIVATDGTLAGIFTDGDLRRLLDLRIDIHQTAIADVMVKNCITAKPEMLAAEALKIMEQRKINGLIVVSAANIPVGAMNMHDLLRAGVM
jgi:arabinose-5-phosphate isomerase